MTNTDLVDDQQAINIDITIPEPFPGWQDEFVRCTSKRQVVMAGRQSAKTYADAIKSVLAFLGTCWNCLGDGCVQCDNTGKVDQRRVFYGAPSTNQLEAFWFEVVDMLRPGIEMGVWKKDETEHTIEVPGTNLMIKAQTAWNVNMLRGRNWEVIILDEYQLMNEQVWTVGAPMLLLSAGTAIFTFTPPSLSSEGVSHAQDPRHAGKMYTKYVDDESGIWKCFHATSFDNPYLNRKALEHIYQDMSEDAYKREILAQIEDIESSWLVYSKFNDEFCKIKRFEVPKNWPVIVGQDFGTANPAALFVAQVKLPLPDGIPPYLRYGDYVAFNEYSPGAGYSAQQHIDRFTEITEGRKMERIVGGNVNSEEETRQLYRRLGWNVVAPQISSVKLQVDRAIAIVEGNQLYVFEDLHRFLVQLANCMWVLDNENRPTNKIKDEAKYHLLACFRYLATVLAPKKRFGEGDRPSPAVNYLKGKEDFSILKSLRGG